MYKEYPLLVTFAGGLATTFPGTSTVESAFFVLGWEKDEYRTMLSDLSLEGILQSKQATELKKISVLLNKVKKLINNLHFSHFHLLLFTTIRLIMGKVEISTNNKACQLGIPIRLSLSHSFCQLHTITGMQACLIGGAPHITPICLIRWPSEN